MALFNNAFAETTANAVQNNPNFLSFVPLIFLFFVFYFFVIRPQRKRNLEEQKMRSSLRVGDKIVTTAGIFGTIMQIDDVKSVVSIEVSKGVSITIYKASIVETLTPKEDVKADKK
jgi:preprotein translocase subunit YajC